MQVKSVIIIKAGLFVLYKKTYIHTFLTSEHICRAQGVACRPGRENRCQGVGQGDRRPQHARGESPGRGGDLQGGDGEEAPERPQCHQAQGERRLRTSFHSRVARGAAGVPQSLQNSGKILKGCTKLCQKKSIKRP